MGLMVAKKNYFEQKNVETHTPQNMTVKIEIQKLYKLTNFDQKKNYIIVSAFNHTERARKYSILLIQQIFIIFCYVSHT